MHKLTQDHRYKSSRRQLLIGATAVSALALTPSAVAADAGGCRELPQSFAGLKLLGGRVRPITAEEFHGRLPRPQKLMSELPPKYDALFVAPGTSLYCFTAIRWDISELLLPLLLPLTRNPIAVM